MGGSHIFLIGANACAIIVVAGVTREPKGDPGLSILESNAVLVLGKIYTTQGIEVPRNLVLATLTSKLAYLTSFSAS